MAEQHGKTLVPQIRFAGFTDPWEQRKLGELEKQDVLHLKRGIVISAADMESCPGNYPVYSSSASQNGEMGKYGKYMFNQELVTWSIDGGGSVFYRPKHKFSVTNVCGYVETSSMVDCAFLAYQMGYIHSQIHFDYTVKAHPSVIRDLYTLSWTSLTEQRRIGAFFDRLDSLITLHQRKYDKLCVLKKSMLDKMFPKGGSLYPEIRFAGFTDPWEQRKVGDFLSESRIKGNTGLNSRKLTVKLWGKGVIEKNDFGGSEHTQYFIRHKGQFIYSKLDFLNSAFGVIPEKLDGYESTADLPAFDLVEMNPHFMFFTAIQEGFYLKHGSAADGSRKAKRIHVNTFLEMPIMVPTVAEQDLIVEYLQSLDCLITLHQRKLELLRNIKKSMLDKMFV